LAPGATSDPCPFPYRVTQADPAPLSNQAFAEGSQVVGTETVTVRDTATHTLEIVTPGLSVTKTPSKSIAAFGETVTFTYIVKNTGSSQITNLQVTDSDPQITFNQPWP